MVFDQYGDAHYTMLTGKRGTILRHAFHRMKETEPELRFEQLLFGIVEAMEGRYLPAAYNITLPTLTALDYTSGRRGRSVPVVCG